MRRSTRPRADGPALRPQGGANTQGSIALVVIGVKPLDVIEQLPVRRLARALRSHASNIVARWRLAKGVTEHPNRVFVVAILDNPEPHFRGFEKILTVFSMSCSMRTRSSSRFSCAIFTD